MPPSAPTRKPTNLSSRLQAASFAAGVEESRHYLNFTRNQVRLLFAT